jgi:hypothetical protein
MAELATRYKIPTIGVVDDGGLTVYPKGPESKPNPWVFDFGLNTFAWGAKIAEYALKHCPDGLAVLHDPSTYGEGGTYGIKQVYDRRKKLAMNDAITEELVAAPPWRPCRRRLRSRRRGSNASMSG